MRARCSTPPPCATSSQSGPNAGDIRVGCKYKSGRLGGEADTAGNGAKRPARRHARYRRQPAAPGQSRWAASDRSRETWSARPASISGVKPTDLRCAEGASQPLFATSRPAMESDGLESRARRGARPIGAGFASRREGRCARSRPKTGLLRPLSQGNDDPLWPANVGHAPEVLVLTDAADEAVAIRGEPVDRRLKVVDFE